MKILTIVGARPQFIKSAAFSKAIIKEPHIEEIIVHTGQHYDANMSDIFFKELGIPKPQYNFNAGAGSHAQMTAKILENTETVLMQEKPDLVVLFGDTNSTLAGGLAASKLHIKVAHIEAGLRSFNKKMPEEINRVLVDHVSEFLFVPTKEAKRNLAAEGIDKGVHIVGDIMKDAYDLFSGFSRVSEAKQCEILVTIHRQENTDDKDKLAQILSELSKVSLSYKVVMPVHPRTRKLIKAYEFEYYLENIEIIDPVGYVEMISLMNESKLIITDSGGLQKEAYFSRTPCITVRDETEWIETLDLGVNILVSVNRDSINDAVDSMLNIESTDSRFDGNVYGDGQTAQTIVNILKANHCE